MPTDAQKRAKAKYNSKSYDRIAFDFPLGVKEKLKEHAALTGTSVNRYVVELVLNDLAKYNTDHQ